MMPSESHGPSAELVELLGHLTTPQWWASLQDLIRRARIEYETADGFAKVAAVARAEYRAAIASETGAGPGRAELAAAEIAENRAEAAEFQRAADTLGQAVGRRMAMIARVRALAVELGGPDRAGELVRLLPLDDVDVLAALDPQRQAADAMALFATFSPGGRVEADGPKHDGTPRVVLGNEERDGWLYRQCVDGVPYKQIAAELGSIGPAKGWEIFTGGNPANSIRAAAQRYAERHDLAPIPLRQHGRRPGK